MPRIYVTTASAVAGSDNDIYIIAGQSNGSGRGTNNQSYSHASLTAYMFGNNYVLQVLTDPVDSETGQLDSVSSDGGSAAGSCWPLLATQIMAQTGRAVIFVPCALGGSSITAWQPGSDHQDRTTLYGSMVYRAIQTLPYGTLKAVLWWQGEADALTAMAQATYNGHLDTLAAAIMADLGIRIMPCKLQNSSGISDANELKINDAIGDAWGDNANVLTGPSFTDIGSDDAYHLMTTAKLQTAADRWYTALSNAGLLA